MTKTGLVRNIPDLKSYGTLKLQKNNFKVPNHWQRLLILDKRNLGNLKSKDHKNADCWITSLEIREHGFTQILCGKVIFQSLVFN